MTADDTVARAMIDDGAGKARYGPIHRINIVTSERRRPYLWTLYQGQAQIGPRIVAVRGWSSTGFPRHVIRWSVRPDD